MTKKNIQSFFPEQYNEVMDMLKRAYMQDENNSLLLLARSKQTLYTLTSQVEQDIQSYMQSKNKDFNLRAIRVNATMSNSEPKFQAKFCEALGLRDLDSKVTSNEFTNRVQEYFQENKELAILFVFEDIDYYVETTRQIMLYKILDMMQHCQIRFVFLCTSMKLDIIDSFEKRIKSRFSHRQVLLYELNFELFMTNLGDQVQELQQECLLESENPAEEDEVDAFEALENMIREGKTKELLQETYDNGK